MSAAQDARGGTLLTRLSVVLAALACAFVLGHVAPAMAIQLTSPNADYLQTARLSVAVESTDATGLAVVSVDGTAVDSRLVVPGDTYELDSVKCPVGSHEAIAVIRSREITSSALVRFKTWDEAGVPVLISPGAYGSQQSNVTVRVGGSTSSLSLYLNGKLVKSRDVTSYTTVNMGQIELAKGANNVTLVAKNPVDETTTRYTVTRLEFPWPTCIIIDKSEFKLYWVRNGTLVKTYPIAIGKASTPTPSATWRIDAKYMTDPAGVYGPRKMRLFRQTSSGYTYTAYGIHGTNQEWVIGTMASHGCIRMYNKDVLELYPQVPLGTMVQTKQ